MRKKEEEMEKGMDREPFRAEVSLESKTRTKASQRNGD
jgi:hypothetical protein